MTTLPARPDWRKSKRSNTQGGSCVEVASIPSGTSDKIVREADLVGGTR